jgi:glycogen debranching enzyme
MEEKKKVLEILKRDLEECITSHGVFASTGVFRDLWARDSMFAVPGLLESGNAKGAHDSISRLLFAERNGQIPLKIARGSQFWRLVGFRMSGRAVAMYGNDKSPDAAIDPNMLLIIGLREYVESSNDLSILDDWTRLERAYAWLLVHMDPQTNLLVQGRYSDWADSLVRSGSTTYAQVIFCEALKSLAWLSRRLHEPDDQFVYMYKKARSALSRLWRGKYFAESLTSNRFDSAANLLAIKYGLTTSDQTKSILRECALRAKPWILCPPMIEPSHPLCEKSFLVALAGMGAYHETHRWSWIGATYLMALKKHNPKHYSIVRDGWFKKIIADDGVYEVYEADGRPVKRLLYRSQKPFAWGAAMMIEALS